MSEKIVVEDLHKIFGDKPDLAMQMLREKKPKEDIFKTTGQIVGVQNANFSIKEGEIFVLMGLSGSGKSTLIRLLNRLIEPTVGVVKVDGHDVAKMNHRKLVDFRRRDMSMVFQSFALLPHRTVLDNTTFGLEIAGVPKKDREKRGLEVLEQVGLEPFAHKLPAHLSGGMQQRVGLARALAVNPSLMLMDEAFSALDPLKRTEMQDVLIKLQKEQKRTIVFVSHDLEEALRIGDRIAIMEGGRIVQIGTRDQILNQPANDYVRTFFKGIDTNKFLTARDVAQRELVPEFPVPRDVRQGVQSMLAELQHHGREFGFVIDGGHQFAGVVSVGSLAVACEQATPTLADALLPAVQPVTADTNVTSLLQSVVRQPYPVPVVNGHGAYLGAVSSATMLKKLAKEV